MRPFRDVYIYFALLIPATVLVAVWSLPNGKPREASLAAAWLFSSLSEIRNSLAFAKDFFIMSLRPLHALR